MKKIYILLSLIAFLGLYSCSNSKPDVNDPASYCFKMEAQIEYKGEPSTTVLYMWSSAKDLYKVIDIYEQNFLIDSLNIKWNIVKSDAKSMVDCQAKN